MDNDGGGNETKGIATATSSTGLLGCTRCALLASVLLYHHAAGDFDTAVFSAAALYPTMRLM